jgi:hypothetical protein
VTEPEAILRNSFPDHADHVRRVKRYNYLGLIKDFRDQTDRKEFCATDYAVFA